MRLNFLKVFPKNFSAQIQLNFSYREFINFVILINMEAKLKTAIFANGCFWCTEAIFQNLRGVYSVTPGYTGGQVKNPTYEEVCGGRTGHVEALKIKYDPEMISYETLLSVFFATHDPTTLNRQGNDVGEQYRSAIFYGDQSEKVAAEEEIHKLNAEQIFPNPIVTEVLPQGEFYEAENYHHDYYENHKDKPYCALIITPKLEKLQKNFSNLLKNK